MTSAFDRANAIERGDKMDHKEARAILTRKLDELGVAINAVFVPDENARAWLEKRATITQKELSGWRLHWSVTLTVRNRPIMLGVDYSQGIGWIPGYTQSLGRGMTIAKVALVARACTAGLGFQRQKIEVKREDVVSSLLLDASVLDHSGFEDWASDLGFDLDSRKAEDTYRLCVDRALAMRAAIGDAVLEELRGLANEL